MSNKRKKKIKPEDNFVEPVADAGEVGGLKLAAWGIILFSFSSMMFFNGEYFLKTYQTFPSIWNSSEPNKIVTLIVPIILFIELLILVARWMIATQHEFNLWKSWLENPFTPVEYTTAIIVLAAALGILPAFPNNIDFTAGFLTVFYFVNYWSQSLANDHFRRALQRTQKTQMHKSKSEVLGVMERYWLKRPQLGRIRIVTFFNFVAFGLALAGKMQPEPRKSCFQLSAYVLLILVLFVSEVVIAWWRYKLDQSIKQIIEAAEKYADNVK